MNSLLDNELRYTDISNKEPHFVNKYNTKHYCYTPSRFITNLDLSFQH